MTRTLKPDEFSVLNPDGSQIPGKKLLQMFKFNINICKIEVTKEGSIRITQNGKSTFSAAKNRWTEHTRYKVLTS